MRLRRLLPLLLLALVATFRTGTPATDPPIRVALAVDVPAVRLGAAAGLALKTPEGRVLARLPGSLRLDARGGQVLLAGRPLGEALLVVPRDGLFQHGGRTYRGHARVLAGPRGLTLVDVLPLERYLEGVLGGEIPPGWPEETQKALAVAARTYALFQVGREAEDDGSPRDGRFDVHPSVRDQVYPGMAGESARSRAAVRATRGQVLSLDGTRPLKAYYSAWCGGHTEDSEAVFGTRVPHLVGVRDPWCRGAAWTARLRVEGLRRLAAPGLARVGELGPTGLDPSGRIDGFRLADGRGGEVSLTGHRLRMLVGPSVLRSTRATMAVVDRVDGSPSVVEFRGVGWGHGVGLCQWGSAEMGFQGLGFDEILRHYYPQATRIRIP